MPVVLVMMGQQCIWKISQAFQMACIGLVWVS